MILMVQSGTSYLNKQKACSRAGSHHYMLEKRCFPPNNGAMPKVAEIINAVMSSTAQSELGALYINACKSIEKRNILHKMGHPHPPSPIQTDNSMVEAIISSKVQPKCTKAMDMRLHWQQGSSINQGQLHYSGAWSYSILQTIGQNTTLPPIIKT
jgi:hypothetical protein